jgi:hypothetical protein
MIEACWSPAPANRPSFAQLLEEFRANHEYAFEGADMEEVKAYEDFITGGWEAILANPQPPVDVPPTADHPVEPASLGARLAASRGRYVLSVFGIALVSVAAIILNHCIH